MIDYLVVVRNGEERWRALSQYDEVALKTLRITQEILKILDSEHVTRRHHAKDSEGGWDE